MRVSTNCRYMEGNADDSTLPLFTTLMDTGSRSLLTVESPLSKWRNKWEVWKLVRSSSQMQSCPNVLGAVSRYTSLQNKL
jgi:hypothetical protein